MSFDLPGAWPYFEKYSCLTNEFQLATWTRFVFVWGCLHVLHNSQFNSTSGLGTLWTWRWRKSYICSSSPYVGPRHVTNSGPSERGPPMFFCVRCPLVPRNPCPSSLSFVSSSPSLACEQLGSPFLPAAEPFNGLRKHRRAASSCRATAWKAAQVAAKAETHPHQPVCAASLWPDFSPSIVVANTKGYNSSVVMRPALNYAPGHSLGQSLCALRGVPSRCQNSGPVTRRLKRFTNVGESSPSLPPLYPPTYRLCSFQLAARPSFAFWLVWDHSGGGLRHSSLLASFSLKLSAA